MSFAIVRMQKFSSGSIGGIQIHDKRLKDNISHTNKDIDWERTHLNYDLLQSENDQYENRNFHKTIKERINSLDLKKAVRKDAVLMAQCLVTSDKEFFDNLTPNKTQQFFKDSYEWLCKRYGKENVISATVHMDERTPHMHFNFVPITSDGRLSAKSVITRQNLIEQQDLFIYDIGEKYGLKRGREGGKKVHLEVIDYKLQTQKEELYKTEKKVNALERQKNALTKEIYNLEGKILDTREIFAIKPKKGLTGGIKDISLGQVEDLKRMAMEYYNLKDKYELLKIDYEIADNRGRTSFDTTKRITSLEEKNRKLERTIKGVSKTLESVPELNQLYNKVVDEKNKVYFEKMKLENKGIQR